MSSERRWSREEEKTFENAIATTYKLKGDDNQWDWEKISVMVQSKSIDEVKRHYEILVEDIKAIEAGLVPLPCYLGEEEEEDMFLKGQESETAPAISDRRKSSSFDYKSSIGNLCSAGMMGNINNDLGNGRQGLKSSIGIGSKSNQPPEKRKGIPWTEEEHRLFLLGLDKFGKGDWRSISRNMVISRTPTQVASHAQKYFIRLNSMNRDRRRTSIHDITSLNRNDISSHRPITGELPNTTTPATPMSLGRPSQKHHHSFKSSGMHSLQKMAVVPGQMLSAIGTPVLIPPHGHHRPPHVPVAYPVVPQAMHPS